MHVGALYSQTHFALETVKDTFSTVEAMKAAAVTLKVRDGPFTASGCAEYAHTPTPAATHTHTWCLGHGVIASCLRGREGGVCRELGV
jgi:hypothetical protein